MIKFLVLCLMIALGLCAYNPSIAKKLAIASAAAFSSDAQIAQWSCKVCSSLPLLRTKAFSNPILDIFGFTGYSEPDKAIILAFRGTVDIQNWIANLDATQVKYPQCSSCLVHQGFYNAFQSVEGYMRKDIQALNDIYPSAKIYITGFTSGGSIATIAALDVKAIIGRADQLYTFGQSRVGNEVFATFVTSRVTQRYRVIHYADIVPHFPPQLPFPYAHFANEIWYDQAMSKYKVCGAEEYTCSKSVLPWSISDCDINTYMKIAGVMEELM